MRNIAQGNEFQFVMIETEGFMNIFSNYLYLTVNNLCQTITKHLGTICTFVAVERL